MVTAEDVEDDHGRHRGGTGSTRRNNKKKKRSGTTCRAVLHACKDISPGTEITIAYDHHNYNGVAFARILYYSALYRFSCACSFCAAPDKNIERFMRLQKEADDIMRSPDIASERPAAALNAAQFMLQGYREHGIKDMREALTWRQCALITAHHSDLGRAMYFIQRAERCFHTLQGPFGYLRRQMLNWMIVPENIPGFGATTRGLSGPADWKKIIAGNPDSTFADRLLFMCGLPRKSLTSSYVRLQQIHDRSRCGPSVNTNKKRRTKKKRKLKKRHDHDKTIRGSSLHGEKRPRSLPDGCTDPERDFLDVVRLVTQEWQEENPSLFNLTEKDLYPFKFTMVAVNRWRERLDEETDAVVHAVEMVGRFDPDLKRPEGSDEDPRKGRAKVGK